MADNQSSELFGQTPSQTVGPFFHYGLPWKGGADLVGATDIGARPDLMPEDHYLLAQSHATVTEPVETITIEGVVVDGQGVPTPDVMVEIWQADPTGRYAGESNSGFIGFGRSSTSEAGVYRFVTVNPGAVTDSDGMIQAPHIACSILGRGMLKRLVTRLYFDGDVANESDPILGFVPHARRDTLIAKARDGVWRFDIVLQGDRETVFFDI